MQIDSAISKSMSTSFNHCSINGNITPMQNASASLKDLGLLRGYGVFDFFKVAGGIPLYLKAHLQRLQHSAQAFRLPMPKDEKGMAEAVYNLIEANDMHEGCIRILLTGGDSADGYQLAAPNCYITPHAFPKKQDAQYQNGIAVCTYDYQREMPDVKSTNYMMGVWLQPWLKEQQADDVIYCRNGVVSETPRSNVFVVTASGELITPAAGMLKGITRNNVLKLAPGIMRVHEQELTMVDLHTAAEIFITSTTKGVLPVCRLNHQPVGNGSPGPYALRLQGMLAELEEQTIAAGRPI